MNLKSILKLCSCRLSRQDSSNEIFEVTAAENSFSSLFPQFQPEYGQECARCKEIGDEQMVYPHRVERLRCPKCGSQAGCDCFDKDSESEKSDGKIDKL